ncbi:MAG: hypothetical protein IJG23_04155 [Clostridia bacterium]|nr:hypothetical protein [Clostridia bacterium]
MSFFINNRETILGILTVIAFVLSVGELISKIIKNRTNYSVDLINANVYEFEDKNQLLSSFIIVNKSSAPLTITMFEFINDDVPYMCILKRIAIAEHYHNKYPETDIPITERIYSTEIPINLSPKQAVMCHIPFYIGKCKNTVSENEKLCFRITTSKGKKTVNLNPKDTNKELKYF